MICPHRHGWLLRSITRQDRTEIASPDYLRPVKPMANRWLCWLLKRRKSSEIQSFRWPGGESRPNKKMMRCAEKEIRRRQIDAIDHEDLDSWLESRQNGIQDDQWTFVGMIKLGRRRKYNPTSSDLSNIKPQDGRQGWMVLKGTPEKIDVLEKKRKTIYPGSFVEKEWVGADVKPTISPITITPGCSSKNLDRWQVPLVRVLAYIISRSTGSYDQRDGWAYSKAPEERGLNILWFAEHSNFGFPISVNVRWFSLVCLNQEDKRSHTPFPSLTFCTAQLRSHDYLSLSIPPWLLILDIKVLVEGYMTFRTDFSDECYCLLLSATWNHFVGNCRETRWLTLPFGPSAPIYTTCCIGSPTP